MYKAANDLFNRLKLEKKELILKYILDEFGRVGMKPLLFVKLPVKQI